MRQMALKSGVHLARFAPERHTITYSRRKRRYSTYLFPNEIRLLSLLLLVCRACEFVVTGRERQTRKHSKLEEAVGTLMVACTYCSDF
jgi:hypothetical protein